jgi:hypothetical protein
MRRAARGLVLLLALVFAACGQGGQEGPRGPATPAGLQTPVPEEPGQPAPTVIPMPPDAPGTMPPSERQTVVPTVQP